MLKHAELLSLDIMAPLWLAYYWPLHASHWLLLLAALSDGTSPRHHLTHHIQYTWVLLYAYSYCFAMSIYNAYSVIFVCDGLFFLWRVVSGCSTCGMFHRIVQQVAAANDWHALACNRPTAEVQRCQVSCSACYACSACFSMTVTNGIY